MTETDTDRALWRSVAFEGPVSQPPDIVLISEWLEGRLQTRDCDEVEKLLAGSPDWCEVMLAARATGGGSVPISPVPKSIMDAARRIGGPSIPRTRTGFTWWVAGSFSWRHLVSGGAFAALMLVIGGGAFLMGQLTYDGFTDTSGAQLDEFSVDEFSVDEFSAVVDVADGAYYLSFDQILDEEFDGGSDAFGRDG